MHDRGHRSPEGYEAVPLQRVIVAMLLRGMVVQTRASIKSVLMVTQAASAGAIRPARTITGTPRRHGGSAVDRPVGDPQAPIRSGVPVGLGLGPTFHVPFGFPVFA